LFRYASQEKGTPEKPEQIDDLPLRKTDEKLFRKIDEKLLQFTPGI